MLCLPAGLPAAAQSVHKGEATRNMIRLPHPAEIWRAFVPLDALR